MAVSVAKGCSLCLLFPPLEEDAAVSFAKGSLCLLFPPLEEDAALGCVLSIKGSLDMFWSSVTRSNSSLNGCCHAAKR